MHVETLRRKRHEARERLFHLWAAALLSGGASAVTAVWQALTWSRWPDVLAPLLSALAVIWIGTVALRAESRIAAGLLLANALVVPYATWVRTGLPSGWLIDAILIVVYFRGLLATLELAELRGVEATEPALARDG